MQGEIDQSRGPTRGHGSPVKHLRSSACYRQPYCKQRLEQLDRFVRHDRDPHDPYFEGHFDLCGCGEFYCPRVMQQGAGSHCGGCNRVTCNGCRYDEKLGTSICKYCDAFLSLADECDDNPEEDGWPHGRPVQVASIRTRVELAPGFSA